MPAEAPLDGSRRERQVMQALFRLGRATAGEVRAALPDPPSDSAVRGVLRVLVGRGRARYEREGKRYVYAPCLPSERAGRFAARDLVRTFFAGSVERAVATLLDASSRRIDDAEYDRLKALIDEARAKRGGPR